MRVTGSLVITAVMLFAVAGTTSAQLADSWSKYRGNAANSGYSDCVVQAGTLKWQCNYPGFSNNDVAVGADGSAYLETDSGVVAINSNGTLKWTFNGGAGLGTPAVASDGSVYYITTNGKLYAINPDGTQRWSYAMYSVTNYGSSSPTLDNAGNVYAAPTKSNLYSINAQTGQLNWARQAGISGSPAIGTDGSIIVLSQDGHVFSYDASGNQKWAVSVPTSSSNKSAAIGPDGTVYVNTDYNGYKTWAISSSGAIKWSLAGLDNSIQNFTIAADGALYGTTHTKSLCRVDASGNITWRYNTPTGDDGILSPCIDATGTIYYVANSLVNTDHYLIALDPGVGEKWRMTIPSYITAPAIGPNGEIYLGGSSIRCYVPEPSSLLAVICGVGSLLALRRRR